MIISKNIFILIFFVIGGIVLQVFLSKLRSKWPGLILPVITFGFSLLSVANIISVETLAETIILIIITLILTNIPTIILLLIYRSVRKLDVKNSEIDKINIQDLS